MDLRWTTFFLLNHLVASQSDPCTTYQTLNDSSFRTDSNSPPDQLSCVNDFPPTPLSQWYRFSATTRGEITTQCPHNSSCGALDQIWIRDPLPRYSDGEISVRTCLKRSTVCCTDEKNITVKTCDGFFVYKFDLAQRCSRYCINTTSIISTTTQATDTLHISVSNTTTEFTASKQTDVPTTKDSSSFFSSTLKLPIVSTTTMTTTNDLSSVSKSKSTTEIMPQPTDDTTTTPNTLLYSVVDFSHESGIQTSRAVLTSVSNSNNTPVISNSNQTHTSTTAHGLNLHESHPPIEHSNTPNVIAAILGSVVGLAVITLIIFLLYRKKCRNQKQRKTQSTYVVHNDIPVVKEESFVEKRKFDVKSIGQDTDVKDLVRKEWKNQKGSEIKSEEILHNDIPMVKEESFIGKRKFDAKSIGQQAGCNDVA